MNPALVQQALAKVVNTHVLVNLVSRRVRQLTLRNGTGSEPLVGDVMNLCAADIALREIIEGKMDFELPAIAPLTRALDRNRRRPQHWGRS